MTTFDEPETAVRSSRTRPDDRRFELTPESTSALTGAGPGAVTCEVGNVHVVANRAPVTWVDGVGWRRAPGGLVGALDSLPDDAITSWIGSAGSLGSPPPEAPGPPNAALSVVELPTSVIAGAVTGMSNSVLWPALHGVDDHVHYRHSYWDAYVAYNAAFSDALIRSCRPGDQVWVHDYHLLLTPQMIKSSRPDLNVGLSLHTAFDDATMSGVARATEIAAALSACDVIGVQTLADIHQLCSFLAHQHQREPTAVRLSPVSIDPHRLATEATTTPTRTATDFVAGVRQRAGSRRLIVGVDRLDYTKGIVERLAAYDLAFRDHGLDPDDVHVVQIAQPSRTDIADYQVLRVDLERIACQLDVDWRRTDGTSPFEILLEPIDRCDVLAVLAAADIAMVTPRRDGMNLVAKEFSILTEHTAGALVLSDRAGAAATLGADAILVDGADPSSVAAGLITALAQDVTDRRGPASRRAASVRSWTARHWADAFISELATSAASK